VSPPIARTYADSDDDHDLDFKPLAKEVCGSVSSSLDALGSRTMFASSDQHSYIEASGTMEGIMGSSMVLDETSTSIVGNAPAKLSDKLSRIDMRREARR
ncbi:unnamed protein product, partial [Amoebophrya sp. A25]